MTSVWQPQLSLVWPAKSRTALLNSSTTEQRRRRRRPTNHFYKLKATLVLFLFVLLFYPFHPLKVSFSFVQNFERKKRATSIRTWIRHCRTHPPHALILSLWSVLGLALFVVSERGSLFFTLGKGTVFLIISDCFRFLGFCQSSELSLGHKLECCIVSEKKLSFLFWF